MDFTTNEKRQRQKKRYCQIFIEANNLIYPENNPNSKILQPTEPPPLLSVPLPTGLLIAH
jgi:hypothetical protein